LSTLSLVGGCRRLEDEVEEYRNGIPREETVKMTAPGATDGKALTIETHQQAAKQGETADFLKLTRAVVVVVNGSGAVVLGLVKLVVSFPPTTVGADSATWGPWPDNNEPVVWKVTVTKVGDHKYGYKFEGRDKAKPEGPFVTVLSGTHTASVDGSGQPIEGYGSGDFTLDFDARNTLPMRERNPLFKDPDVGKAMYRYARLSTTSTVEVDAQFRQVKDDNRPGQRVDIDYQYRQAPGGGGSMDFVSASPQTMMMAGGVSAVKTRWTKDGAGRSDIRAKGGDIPGGVQATVSECWNGSYAAQFLRISWAPILGYGVEATDCVFPTAEYSNL
jgi:hypothetical protein